VDASAAKHTAASAATADQALPDLPILPEGRVGAASSSRATQPALAGLEPERPAAPGDPTLWIFAADRSTPPPPSGDPRMRFGFDRIATSTGKLEPPQMWGLSYTTLPSWACRHRVAPRR
jgi:hypothetical protein